MINGTIFLLVILPAMTIFGVLGIGIASARMIKAGRPNRTAIIASPPESQRRQATGG
ncbi:hypothetical protein [Methylobacterium sp. Leaf117]|uniref:hypothetical protein n=1 Tax=Methylobacterium sp. Leaf117 TaxID=1736260 RepID=UPI000A76CA2F|nr:hypothetical protein [Methylobacterium sp. Leaf117]